MAWVSQIHRTENAAQRLSNAYRQAALIESLIAFVRSGFREEKAFPLHRVAKACLILSLYFKYNWYRLAVCGEKKDIQCRLYFLLSQRCISLPCFPTHLQKPSGRSRVALDKSSVARELQGALLSWFPSTTSLILCGCSLATHANHENIWMMRTTWYGDACSYLLYS